MPSGCRRAVAADQSGDQDAGLDGPSLVAACREDEARARRRLYRLGDERYRDRLMLAGRARAMRRDCAHLARARQPCRIAGTRRNFRSRRRISSARGIAEGPALGHVLALAEDAWLAADFPLRQPALEAIADQTVTRFNRDHRLVSFLSGFADISIVQLLLVAGDGAVRLGDRRAGRLRHRRADAAGAGAVIGAEPVVPIIAISSIFTNLSRFTAYLRYADRRRALIVTARRPR